MVTGCGGSNFNKVSSHANKKMPTKNVGIFLLVMSKNLHRLRNNSVTNRRKCGDFIQCGSVPQAITRK